MFVTASHAQAQGIDVASIEPIQSFLSLYIDYYSNLYKGIRSFVLVPWMQRQCPMAQDSGKRFITASHVQEGVSSNSLQYLLLLTMHRTAINSKC